MRMRAILATIVHPRTCAANRRSSFMRAVLRELERATAHRAAAGLFVWPRLGEAPFRRASHALSLRLRLLPEPEPRADLRQKAGHGPTLRPFDRFANRNATSHGVPAEVVSPAPVYDDPFASRSVRPTTPGRAPAEAVSPWGNNFGSLARSPYLARRSRFGHPNWD